MHDEFNRADGNLGGNWIDKEPITIHPHCQPGCAMNLKDPENQCGNGCILVTVYGPSVAIMNPRYPRSAPDITVVVEEYNDPKRQTHEPFWVDEARRFEAKPWWRQKLHVARMDILDWWGRFVAWLIR